VSVDDLAKLESEPLGPAPAGALALVGAWSDVEDEALDEFLDEILQSRAEDKGRPVGLEQ
jgi:hypothetical protein